MERADRRLYYVLAGADELGQSRIARTRAYDVRGPNLEAQI